MAMKLTFKVCKENDLSHEIKVQPINQGQLGQIQNVPKHPTTVDFEQQDNGKDALYIWTTACSKPKLKLVYIAGSAPQEVTVTVGEK